MNCPKHGGVKQIESQFGENGSQMTYAFGARVIEILQECSIKSSASLCGISWDKCWNALERAVERGLARKSHRVPPRIGVDEKSIARGHKYESLVYNIDAGTVEYVCDDRRQESLEGYYRQFTRAQLEQVEAIAMDMWDPYIAATKAYVPDAHKKIVFDRFHVMRRVVDAVDKVRKLEHRQLVERGLKTLAGIRYLWLWSKENIPPWRQQDFQTLKAKDLKVCRAWAIKENLRHLWAYRYEAWMRKYFKRWYFWATHSRLEPIIKAAKTFKSHLDNIVTYARHRITNAMAEGINAKIEKIDKAISKLEALSPKLNAYHLKTKKWIKTAVDSICKGIRQFVNVKILTGRKQVKVKISPSRTSLSKSVYKNKWKFRHSLQ